MLYQFTQSHISSMIKYATILKKLLKPYILTDLYTENSQSRSSRAYGTAIDLEQGDCASHEEVILKMEFSGKSMLEWQEGEKMVSYGFLLIFWFFLFYFLVLFCFWFCFGLVLFLLNYKFLLSSMLFDPGEMSSITCPMPMLNLWLWNPI